MKAPRRRTRGETRTRLLQAASTCFAEDGYFGTDSNKIARAAGFAPGTFYKHFADKRAVLLAAYEAWVVSEWEEVQAILETAHEDAKVAERLAHAVLAHHRKWAGLRRSLRAAAAMDDAVRDFQLAQRRRQLAWFASVRVGKQGRARNLALLLELERLCDATAEGDAKRLGVTNAEMEREVERVIADYLA